MAQVYNFTLVAINGNSEEIPISDYIQSFDDTTGGQSAHVKTMTTDGSPIAVNPMVNSPSASITFAAGAFAKFYQFLYNDRTSRFDFNVTWYTLGNLDGDTQSFQYQGCVLDTTDTNSAAERAAGIITVRVNATKKVPL